MLAVTNRIGSIGILTVRTNMAGYWAAARKLVFTVGLDHKAKAKRSIGLPREWQPRQCKLLRESAAITEALCVPSLPLRPCIQARGWHVSSLTRPQNLALN